MPSDSCTLAPGKSVGGAKPSRRDQTARRAVIARQGGPGVTPAAAGLQRVRGRASGAAKDGAVPPHICAAAADAVIAQAWVTGVPAAQIGVTGGTELTLTGAGTISLETLRSAHEGWLPGLMSTPA